MTCVDFYFYVPLGITCVPINFFFLHSLILPPRNNKQKHSPTHDQSDNIKRRKTDDILLSPPVSSNKEISNLMEKNVLEILNTPLVEKTISSPSINTSFSSILKVCFIA